MRLIDADKFIAQIEDQYMEHDITRAQYLDLEDRILQQPTVDAVPVVRCYECKHFLDEEGVRYCELHYNMMEYDGFCSIGERKDGDHETD